MVREELKLGKAKLPDEQLEEAWAALDSDKSGFVVAEEFGAFMKRGAGPKGPTWKERRQAAQDAKGAEARADKLTGGGRRIIDAPPASAEDMLELSQMLNKQLCDEKLFPKGSGTDWFKMCATATQPPHATTLVALLCRIVVSASV